VEEDAVEEKIVEVFEEWLKVWTIWLISTIWLS
jgi:hypothetical protein